MAQTVVDDDKINAIIEMLRSWLSSLDRRIEALESRVNESPTIGSDTEET